MGDVFSLNSDSGGPVRRMTSPTGPIGIDREPWKMHIHIRTVGIWNSLHKHFKEYRNAASMPVLLIPTKLEVCMFDGNDVM